MSDSQHIVVVDDNPATRYTTARVLRASGFKVTEAASGGEGLAAVDSSVSAVVLDINLPDIDGFEVCRRLREQKATSRIPILHISATLTTEMDKAYGLASGADGYLIHPVEPLVLTATINSLLRTRHAENELLRSEAKFRAIFDGAPSGIALLNHQRHFEEVNPALCKLLGRERSEIVGKSMIEFVPEERRQQVWHLLQDLEASGKFRGVFPILHRNGAISEIEWNMSNDAALGVQLAIAVDITQEMRSEAERERLLASERAARSEAERANRLKDEFLATLSHELRNPLNAIIGWASVLRPRHVSPEFTQGLEAIERNARVQAQLISDLLDVSRIIAGKLRLDVEWLDPMEIVRSALDSVMPAAQAKQIDIRPRLYANDVKIRGDSARLQQVIWNLLSNAVKFTPKGGKVEVELVQADSNLELTVADNGRGVRPEFLPHLFERFRQEDASVTKSYSGLGLGLAIVKHLTEMHGGSVRAASEGEGKGAMFTVSLPVSAVSGGAVADAPHIRTSVHFAQPLALEGVKVLVVEDDSDARALIALMLREVKAEVSEAGSVDEALPLLDDFRPNLLVSDIGMARRDGYELIRHVRRRGFSAADLPAIALTAFARLEDRREALLAGYQLHLSKPVDSQELLSAVASLVGRTA